MPESENKRGGLAGEKARKWRRGIGALVEAGAGADTRTRKFPLELPDDENPFDFAEAAKLFDIMEGAGETGPGALAGFLCATHLSGFRVCGGEKEAREYCPKMKGIPGKPTVAWVRPPIALSQTDAEYELHKTIALLAREIRAEGEVKGKVVAGGLKRPLLGGGESAPHGMSWLFGAGLAELLANPEISDKEVARMLAADLRAVRQLRARARTVLLPPPFYRGNNYSDFRVQLAQKLGGWIGNYWKRLGELEARMDKPQLLAKLLPPKLGDESAGELFERKDYNFADLKASIDSLRENLDKARKALEILTGRNADRLPGKSEAKTFAGLNDRVDELAGRLRELQNLAEQRAEDVGKSDSKFWAGLNKALKRSVGSLEKFEKLNRISGGTPVVKGEKGEVAQTEAAFNALWNHRRDCFREIVAAAPRRDIVSEAGAEEREKLRKFGMNENQAREFAVRRMLLLPVARAAQNMSRLENRELVEKPLRPLFGEEKDGMKRANKFLVNRQGAIYRSPYSNSRHQRPVDLHHQWEEAALKTDWPGHLESVAAQIEKRMARHDSDGRNRVRHFRDWMECVRAAVTMRLRELPDELSGEKTAAILDLSALPEAVRETLRPSPALAESLRESRVPRRRVVSAFNQLQSALRGLAFRVMRESFIVRTSFRPIQGSTQGHWLVYAPKSPSDKRPNDGRWIPPERYRRKYADAFSAVVADAPIVGAFCIPDAAAAAESLLQARKKKGLTAADRTFLAELPHDWLFPVGESGKWNIASPPMRKGIPVSKNGSIGGNFKLQPRAGLRLCGPNSMKTALDDCLRADPKRRPTEREEHTLLLTQEWNQQFQRQNGELTLTSEKGKLHAELAVPVQTRGTRKGDEFFGRLVAVDLGERGIGWAVFDVRKSLESANGDRMKIVPMKTGTVAIPSIRALIRAVRRHRGRAQPMQKVRDSHSRALEKRRKNVVGDVCNAIDNLCAEWGAFPVLEDGVQNLESGGKQLQLVYGSVLRRYADSNIAAHKQQRREYWFTGAKKDGKRKTPVEAVWTHPTLVGKNGPLKLHPGGTVPAAGTSRECSKCGLNPFEMLRGLGKRELTFRDGFADFTDAKGRKRRIFLLRRTTKQCDDSSRENAAQRDLRRRKLRPQMSRLFDGTVKANDPDLLRRLKFNLRRPPVSARSRDTSQSRYFCVFADCRAETHADENAAVNIGRRLLSNMDREQSRKKLASGN